MSRRPTRSAGHTFASKDMAAPAIAGDDAARREAARTGSAALLRALLRFHAARFARMAREAGGDAEAGDAKGAGHG